MKCIITIPSAGGGNGRPKRDRIGPLEEFLVDNQVFYKYVREHLAQCTVCDPRAVLEVYLERRRTQPKFKGVASATFVKNAVAYIKLCKKRGVPVPADLIAEAIGRGMEPDSLAQHAEVLGVENVARALLVMRQVLVKSHHIGPTVTRLSQIGGFSGRLGTGWKLAGSHLSWLIPLVDEIYDNGGTLPPADELEDLSKVAEVMLS